MFETIDWYGMVLPFCYMVVLSGALMTFSSIYRKRRAGTFLDSTLPDFTYYSN